MQLSSGSIDVEKVETKGFEGQLILEKFYACAGLDSDSICAGRICCLGEAAGTRCVFEVYDDALKVGSGIMNLAFAESSRGDFAALLSIHSG